MSQQGEAWEGGTGARGRSGPPMRATATTTAVSATNASPPPRKAHSGSMPTVSPLTPSPQCAHVEHHTGTRSSQRGGKGGRQSHIRSLSRDHRRRASSAGDSHKASNPPVQDNSSSSTGSRSRRRDESHCQRRSGDAGSEGEERWLRRRRRGSLFASLSRSGSPREASPPSRVDRPCGAEEQGEAGVLPTYYFPSPTRVRPQRRAVSASKAPHTVERERRSPPPHRSRDRRGTAKGKRRGEEEEGRPQVRLRRGAAPSPLGPPPPPPPRVRRDSGHQRPRGAGSHAHARRARTLPPSSSRRGSGTGARTPAPPCTPAAVVFVSPQRKSKKGPVRPRSVRGRSSPSAPSSSTASATSTLRLVPSGSASSTSPPRGMAKRTSGNGGDADTTATSSSSRSAECSSVDLCSCCREQVVRLENHYKLLVVRLLREMAAMEAAEHAQLMMLPKKPAARATGTSRQTAFPTRRRDTEARTSGLTSDGHPAPGGHPRPARQSPSGPPLLDPSSTCPSRPPSPPAASTDEGASTEWARVHFALTALAKEVAATKLALRHHILSQAAGGTSRCRNEEGWRNSTAAGQREGEGDADDACEREGRGGSGSTDNNFQKTSRPAERAGDRDDGGGARPPLLPTSSARTEWVHRFNVDTTPAPHDRERRTSSASGCPASHTDSEGGQRQGLAVRRYSSPDPLPPPPLSPLVDHLLSSLSQRSYHPPPPFPHLSRDRQQQGSGVYRATGEHREHVANVDPTDPTPSASGNGQESSRGRTSSGSAGAATTVHTQSRSRPSPSLSQSAAQPGGDGSGAAGESQEQLPFDGGSTSHSRPSGSGSRNSVRTQPSPSPPSPHGARGVYVASSTAHPADSKGEEGREKLTHWGLADKENDPSRGHHSSCPRPGSHPAVTLFYVEGNSPEKRLHTGTYSLKDAIGGAKHGSVSRRPGAEGEGNEDEKRQAKATVREPVTALCDDSTDGPVRDTAAPSRRKYVHDLSPEEIAASRRGRTRRAIRESFGRRSETASTAPASPLSSSEETALLLSLMYPAAAAVARKATEATGAWPAEHPQDRPCGPARADWEDGGDASTLAPLSSSSSSSPSRRERVGAASR